MSTINDASAKRKKTALATPATLPRVLQAAPVSTTAALLDASAPAASPAPLASEVMQLRHTWENGERFIQDAPLAALLLRGLTPADSELDPIIDILGALIVDLEQHERAAACVEAIEVSAVAFAGLRRRVEVARELRRRERLEAAREERRREITHQLDAAILDGVDAGHRAEKQRSRR